MKASLEWLANLVGGFAAAYVVYVAIGGMLGLLLAKPFTYPSQHECWPVLNRERIEVTTECENSLSSALWFGAVQLPNNQISQPAMALRLIVNMPLPGRYVTTSTYLVDSYRVYISSTIILSFSVVGLLVWRVKFLVGAWILAAVLVSQILLIGLHPSTFHEISKEVFEG